jgi:hypothetical protein
MQLVDLMHVTFSLEWSLLAYPRLSCNEITNRAALIDLYLQPSRVDFLLGLGWFSWAGSYSTMLLLCSLPRPCAEQNNMQLVNLAVNTWLYNTYLYLLRACRHRASACIGWIVLGFFTRVVRKKQLCFQVHCHSEYGGLSRGRFFCARQCLTRLDVCG